MIGLIENQTPRPASDILKASGDRYIQKYVILLKNEETGALYGRLEDFNHKKSNIIVFPHRNGPELKPGLVQVVKLFIKRTGEDKKGNTKMFGFIIGKNVQTEKPANDNYGEVINVNLPYLKHVQVGKKSLYVKVKDGDYVQFYDSDGKIVRGIGVDSNYWKSIYNK